VNKIIHAGHVVVTHPEIVADRAVVGDDLKITECHFLGRQFYIRRKIFYFKTAALFGLQV